MFLLLFAILGIPIQGMKRAYDEFDSMDTLSRKSRKMFLDKSPATDFGLPFQSWPVELLEQVNYWMDAPTISATRSTSRRLNKIVEFRKGSGAFYSLMHAIENNWMPAILEYEPYMKDPEPLICYRPVTLEEFGDARIKTICSYGLHNLNDENEDPFDGEGFNFVRNCSIDVFKTVLNEPFLRLFSPGQLSEITKAAFSSGNKYLMKRLSQLEVFNLWFIDSVTNLGASDSPIKQEEYRVFIDQLASMPIFKYFDLDNVLRDGELGRVILFSKPIFDSMNDDQRDKIFYNVFFESPRMIRQTLNMHSGILDRNRMLGMLRNQESKRQVEAFIHDFVVTPDYFNLNMNPSMVQTMTQIIYEFAREKANVSRSLMLLSRLVANPDRLGLFNGPEQRHLIQVFVVQNEPRAINLFRQFLNPEMQTLNLYSMEQKEMLMEEGMKNTRSWVIRSIIMKAVTVAGFLDSFEEGMKQELALNFFRHSDPRFSIHFIDDAFNGVFNLLLQQPSKFTAALLDHMRVRGRVLNEYLKDNGPGVLESLPSEICFHVKQFAKHNPYLSDIERIFTRLFEEKSALESEKLYEDLFNEFVISDE